jgi:RHS repeat-associated protein
VGTTAAGQPVRRRVAAGGGSLSAPRHLVWDGAQLVAELDSLATARVGEYAYYPGIDRPMAFASDTGASPALRWLYQDALGNVVAAAKQDSVLSYKVSYSPWGEPAVGGADSATAGRLLWKGLAWDAPTGLYYVRARWYDPKAGRFVSEDPIGLAGGQNVYAFGGGDPVNRVDPSGTRWCLFRGVLCIGGGQDGDCLIGGVLICGGDLSGGGWGTAPRLGPEGDYWSPPDRLADSKGPLAGKLNGPGVIDEAFHRAIPARVCSGGAFAFAGKTFGNPHGFKAEGLAIGGYDSADRWQIGGLVAFGYKDVVIGGELTYGFPELSLWGLGNGDGHFALIGIGGPDYHTGFAEKWNTGGIGGFLSSGIEFDNVDLGAYGSHGPLGGGGYASVGRTCGG